MDLRQALSVKWLSMILIFGMLHLARAEYGLQTHIPGELRIRLLYSPAEGLSARGGAKTTLQMTAGSEGDLRAVIGMDNTIVRTDPDLDGPFEEDLSSSPASVRFHMSSFRIEGHGALWRDGPAVRLRLGQFYTNYSDWIARSVGRNGIELHGMPIGDHALRLYYGLPAKWFALRIDGGVNEQFGRLVTLHRPGVDGEADETDAHLYVRLGSARGSHYAVNLAHDGTSRVGAIQFAAVRRQSRDQWIGVSALAVHEDFNPPRARRNRAGDTVAFTAGQMGIEVEAVQPLGSVVTGMRVRRAVSVQGPHQRGSESLFITHSDQITSRLEFSRDPHDEERTPYIIEFEREHGSEGPRYTAVIEWDQTIADWEVRAHNAANVLGQEVAFMALFGGMRPEMRAKVQAEWDAPNGLRLGVHYASHNSEAFGLESLEWHPAGLYVTATALVEF